MFAYTRPMLGLLILSSVMALALSGTRVARSYLMKPILDDIVLPNELASKESYAPAWLKSLPLIGRGEESPAVQAEPDTEAVAAQREAIRESVSNTLNKVILAAIALVLGTPILMFARGYMVSWILEMINIEVMRDLCAKLLSLPLGFHYGMSRGDLLTRAFQDATTVHGTLRTILQNVVEAAAMVVIGVVFLFFISWPLALGSVLVGPAIFGVITIFGRRIKSRAHDRQAKKSDVAGRMVDILAGIKIIKAFRAESAETEAFRRQTKKLLRRSMRVAVNREMAQSLIAMLNNGMVVGMLMLGVLLILEGRFDLTPGDLAAFALVLTTTYGPVRQISKGWVSVSDSEASIERFCEILDAPGEIADVSGAITIDGVHNEIAFRGVSFSYGREQVLHDVSFVANAGEVVALVGRTGAGKTTIADLLMRFHDPTTGSIEIDGVDLRGIVRASLLDHMAVVTQETFLFDGTIAQNIRYGRVDASEEEVLDAARAAHVDEFASSLPDGYETEVGTDGVRLSGGQRQRITIARALLKNPAILVFDEATSALDSKSENLVQDAVDSLLGGRTVLVIAHRLSTIRRADRIIVLEDGRITQNGTHAELSEQIGLYRELLLLQAAPDSSD
jgi:subfamily B ATP-binding cassette protein MsbA